MSLRKHFTSLSKKCFYIENDSIEKVVLWIHYDVENKVELNAFGSSFLGPLGVGPYRTMGNVGLLES